MRCLYCGREIGAFRLLREREFCSADHRKNYGTRLNKALHQIAEPEPPPAGVATFAVSWPTQPGSILPTLVPWNAGREYPLYLTRPDWKPVDADDSDLQEPPFCHRCMPALQAEPVAVFLEASTAPAALAARSVRVPAFSLAANMAVQVPPMRSRWMPCPPAAPVARYVASASAGHIACAPALQAFRLAGDTSTRIPPPFVEWMSTAAPEPVAIMVLPSAATVFVSRLATVQFRALELAPEHDVLATPEQEMAIPAACDAWMPSLVAEPVAQLVWPAAGDPFFTDISLLLGSNGLPSYALPAIPKPHGPAACTSPMPVPAAEPVSSLVCHVAVRDVIATESVAELPALTLSAVLAPTADDEEFAVPPPCEDRMRCPEPEPVFSFVKSSAAGENLAGIPLRLTALNLTIADPDMLVVPPPCEDWMRVPEPEPVFSFVRSSVAGEVLDGIALQPATLNLSIADPHIPSVDLCRPVPSAEPVMASVWLHVDNTPHDLAPSAELQKPGIAAVSAFPEPSAATPTPAKPAHAKPAPKVAASVPALVPVPVESWLQVAANSVPAIAAQTVRALPMPAAPALVASGPLPVMAGSAAAPPPVGAESLLASSSAAAAPYPVPVQMQNFDLAADTATTAPSFDKPGLAPAVAEPARPDNVMVLRPIWSISVIAPEQHGEGPGLNVPRPEFVLMEYHAQRMRSEPVCQLPWQAPHLQPVPPRFALRPAFDRIEEEAAAAQKPVRKEPAFAEVFTMPEAKRPTRKLSYAGKAIAAGLVIGGMWLGTSVVRLVRQPVAQQEAISIPAIPSPAPVLSADSRQAASVPAPAESKGPVAWVRKTIANRASYQAGDNFRAGMEAWSGSNTTYKPRWERSADGYVRPTEMALFTPSLKLSDYRFDFLGQVEKKSLSWAVRAKDPENYYAMKVKVLEAGLRPIIGVVHYPVVGGKPGHRVETPLNVMVHNNRPFQISVNVKGNRFSASIEGEEVDSWTDDSMLSGGVGFFADAGESARLYWMKVTRNDDWLGRVCGMLSGGDSGTRKTSELRDPQPGGMPRPTAPEAPGNATMAAAAIGLPACRARKLRDSKYGRYQPWSS